MLELSIDATEEDVQARATAVWYWSASAAFWVVRLWPWKVGVDDWESRVHVLDVSGVDGIDAFFNSVVDGFLVSLFGSGWRKDEHIEVEE
jgi:hypothetical protein